MTRERIKILVTVKAYPNPSTKYGETVCIAGIDIDTLEWIRLYPVQFRDLESDKQFKKYSIIEAYVRKAAKDKRPESYNIDEESIRIIDELDIKDRWKKRKEIVLPTVQGSMCELFDLEKRENRSLGCIKPSDIEFYHMSAKEDDTEKEKASYAQLSFLHGQKEPIEHIPFDFRYTFKCEDIDSCRGHDFQIIDWEIKQAYRSWRGTYKDEEALLEKIKERWLNLICSELNDVYFYVGNVHRFPETFMILGIFYPPKK